jgi:hypothetical protein
MKEPRRLLHEGATDFERQLLRAVAGERPSPRLEARMRRGLGISGAVLWAGNVKAMLATLAGKGVLGVTLAGLATVAGVATYRHMTAEVPSREVPAALLAAAPAAPASPAAASNQPAIEPPPAASQPNASASELSADNGQLREEILLLDRARSSLREGSASQALTLLDDYRQRFPAGILKREAELLRQRSVRGASSTSHGPERRRQDPR